MSIKDKKVIVIGGSSGIGLAVAKLALTAGAEVVIASRSLEKLSQAKTELNDAVTIRQIDMLNEASIKNFFAEVGHFDHLQLSGSEVRFGNMDTLSLADAKYSFDSKFWGPYTIINHARSMIAKTGSITLYSGAASQRPNKESTILTALNAAVEALARALAIAITPIRVNVISPGITFTPLFSSMDAVERNKILEAYKINLLVKRFATADEVAQTAIYLMENDYVTGSLQMVDGGLSIT